MIPNHGHGKTTDRPATANALEPAWTQFGSSSGSRVQTTLVCGITISPELVIRSETANASTPSPVCTPARLRRSQETNHRYSQTKKTLISLVFHSIREHTPPYRPRKRKSFSMPVLQPSRTQRENKPLPQRRLRVS